jgi:hypothetical protein
MGTSGFPDIVGFWDMLYGTAGLDYGGLTLMYFGGASGMVFSGNPPYTVTDFFNFYSKFAGPASPIKGDVTQGSNIITNISSGDVVGLATGQLLVSPYFAKDTIIVDIGATNMTVSNPSTSTVSASSITVFETPFIPIIVVLTYVNLALASVMQSRYKEAWYMMINLFIAHYCTLFMRTETGTPNLTASQVASSGLAMGITVSRAAGDVSATQELLLEDYLEWGAWTQTEYGIQFITIARATNMGPIWVP